MGLNSTINFISWLISSIIPMIIVSIIVAGIIPSSILPKKPFRPFLSSRSQIRWNISCVRTDCDHHSITDTRNISIDARVCLDWIEINRYDDDRSLFFRYLVSAFFTKANLATLCGILIYFISYLPFILIMFLEAKMKLIHKLLIVSFRSIWFAKNVLLPLAEFIQCYSLRIFFDLSDTFRIPRWRCSMAHSFQKYLSQRWDEFRYSLCDDVGGFDYLWSHWQICSIDFAGEERSKETILVSMFTVDMVFL